MFDLLAIGSAPSDETVTVVEFLTQAGSRIEKGDVVAAAWQEFSRYGTGQAVSSVDAGVVQFGSNAGRTAMMARHIQWGPALWFAVGIVLGIGLGASVVPAIPPAVVLIGVGLFLIWTVLSKPPAWMRDWPLLTGTLTSVLSMAFGASGPFVNTYVKSLDLGRHAHVATTAVLLSGQHLLKALAFGVLGFAYAPWAGLIAALILCGLAGTWTGKQVLNRLSDARFRQALNAVLLLLSARLVWQGLSLLL